ncbi:MAG: chromosome segregation protein ParM [Kluyvera sp.]|uniref:chromosome segregation protein ParM n=1 Tax=Kluyvera sp. TaxID=1538228 RepID=UPI003A83C3B0
MRLSAIQKDLLFVLYALRERNPDQTVIPSVRLFRMLEQNSRKTFFATNFRTSCHTLHRHGLLSKYRNASMKLAFGLTDTGADIARDIYTARLKTL